MNEILLLQKKNFKKDTFIKFVKEGGKPKPAINVKIGFLFTEMIEQDKKDILIEDNIIKKYSAIIIIVIFV